LPEAQLDRFLIRVGLGYPAAVDEAEILHRRIARRQDEAVLRPVIDRTDFLALQQAIEDVHVAPTLVDYLVRLVEATRAHAALLTGASPRGTLALLKAARALAALGGREYVTPDDVKWVAPGVLSHRIVLRPELWVQGTTTSDVVAQCLGTVPTPDPVSLVRD
jgi:MoxR-like ATPase